MVVAALSGVIRAGPPSADGILVVVDVDVLVAEDEDTIGSVVVVVGGGGIWEAVSPIVVAAVISLIIVIPSVDENCE